MKRAALISIYREHVDNILSGRKIFEYRKTAPRHEISHLVFYCSAPTQKIVAVADVQQRVEGSRTKIWEDTAIGGGISRRIFRAYYAGRDKASVFVLGYVYKMETPLDLSVLSGCPVPPQSFRYLGDANMKLISKRKSAIPSTPGLLLFMGGIHGVGKTTRAGEVSDPTGYEHFNAGDLITARSKKTTSPEKRVQNIAGNQAMLLEAIERVRESRQRILLTGHFTMMNKKGEIEPVDVGVFRDMRPDRLILLHGDPQEIRRNLHNRDGKECSVAFIRKFQTREKAQAQRVSAELGIPLHILHSDDTAGLKKLLYESRIPEKPPA